MRTSLLVLLIIVAVATLVPVAPTLAWDDAECQDWFDAGNGVHPHCKVCPNGDVVQKNTRCPEPPQYETCSETITIYGDWSDEDPICNPEPPKPPQVVVEEPQLPPWQPSWPACDAKLSDILPWQIEEWFYRCEPQAQVVEPTATPEAPCPDCPPAQCLLQPGNFVQVANQYVGLTTDSNPLVFTNEDEAINSGLVRAGYECGLCAEHLVREGTVFITTGSTAYDIAVALNLAEGSPFPNYGNRHMAAAQHALQEWAKAEKVDGWYSIG